MNDSPKTPATQVGPDIDTSIGTEIISGAGICDTRTNSSSIEEKLPSWAILARDAMEDIMSNNNKTIVNLWCEFETLAGPNHSKGRLTSKGRPQQIPDWTQRRRQYDKSPPIESPSSFAALWRVWWTSMQPKSRIVEENTWPMKRTVDANEKWEKLLKGGENGLVLVLLSLSWWLKSTKKRDETRECLMAIEDVEWVLGKLVDRLREIQASSDEAEIDEGDVRGQKR